MGILSAMNKSVGGLTAQSFALENISGNIANAQTTAFKRTDTSFADLISAGTNRVENMAAGNVRATSRSTISLQGSVEASSTETFMAVKGAGYFVVRQRTGEIDGSSVFSTSQLYSRRGDYQIDREGYLVNGAGYYLAGLPIDQATNNPAGDTPDIIKITNDPVPAEVTTEITYKLNLPKVPITKYSTDNPDYSTDNMIWTNTHSRTGPPASGNISGTLESEFLENSISGEAVTVYDAAGKALNVQVRWAKTDNTAGAEVWKPYYLTNSSATGASTKWTQLDDGGTAQDFTFDSDGSLTTPSTGKITISSLTVDGTTLSNVDVKWGSTGVTQYADTSGKANVRQLTQDGLPAGNFQDVKISDGGRVVANYSNGKQVDLYQIPLVSFSGEAWLKPLDGGAYAETKESGPAASNANGTVVGAALESSNVDIGEEFTKLIVTQQAFSANSKVITTADQMMNDILNVIR